MIYKERPELRCDVLTRNEHFERQHPDFVKNGAIGSWSADINKLVIDGYLLQCEPRCTCDRNNSKPEAEPTPASTAGSEGKGVK
ncbi:MAG: hypothetical protein AAB538_00925 [Patescibacteria group bacterium]